jgi:hypothetical protein
MCCTAFSYGDAVRELDVLAGCLGLKAPVGRQYLVLIAIDTYASFPPLKRPKADAEALRRILEEDYFFDASLTKTLYDGQATKENILDLFAGLQNELAENDSLLIFFAGHGEQDTVTNTYFWIPADGDGSRSRQTNWLPLSQVRGALCRMKARHILLVADSCFSGELLALNRGSPQRIESANVERLYAPIARLILTSGSSEYVPDNGEFSGPLLSLLSSYEGLVLDSLMLYNDVRLRVKETTPLYGGLEGCEGQQGGVFVFFKKPRGTGSLAVNARSPGRLFMNGAFIADVHAGSNTIDGIAAGAFRFNLIYADNTEELRSAIVRGDATAQVEYIYVPKKERPEQIQKGAAEESRAREKPPFLISVSGACTIPISEQSAFYSPSSAWGIQLSYDIANVEPFSFCGITIGDFFSHSSPAQDNEKSVLSVVDVSEGLGIGIAMPFLAYLELHLEAGFGYALSFFDYSKYSGNVVSGDVSFFTRVACRIRIERLILIVHTSYLGILYKDIPLQEWSIGGGVGFGF